MKKLLVLLFALLLVTALFVGCTPAEEPAEELPAEEEFATADVAAGADEPEGREERE